MDTNESDPLDEIESDLLDANDTKSTSTIEPPYHQGGHYFLTPYCCDGHNDQWLVPGAPGGLGQVVLMPPDPNNLETVWRIYTEPESGTFTILNNVYLGPGMGTGLLTAPNDDSPVVMLSEFDSDFMAHKDRYRYNFKALPVLDGTWYMIQLVENPGVYLNVSGDGPYPAGTPILVYSSPGAPSGDSPGAEANQVWRFHYVSD